MRKQVRYKISNEESFIWLSDYSEASGSVGEKNILGVCARMGMGTFA